MRAPQRTESPVRAAAGGQAMVRQTATPGAFGVGVSQALGQLGTNVQALGLKQAEKQDSLDRFGALTRSAQFQDSVNEELAALKRQAPLDVRNFPDTVDALYEQRAADFLATVPEDLRPEFESRIAAGKGAVVADALTFQYTANDEYFRKGVADQLTRSLVVVSEDAATMEAERDLIFEQIANTDLSEIEKQSVMRNVNIALQGAAYKKEVEALATGGGLPSLPQGDVDAAITLIMDREGKELTAYPDTGGPSGQDFSGYRVGYGSDTVTRADGTVERVTKDTVITEAEAIADIERRTADLMTQNEQIIGPIWNELPSNIKAAITSAAYNYGSLDRNVMQDLVAAARTGDPEVIAKALEARKGDNSGINSARRQQEADIVRGRVSVVPSEIRNDPRFADVPFDTRVAIEQDAIAAATQAQTARAKQEEALYNERFNTLLLGLNDGTAGATEIQVAREQGWLSDYDAVAKAENILAQRMKADADAFGLQQALADPNWFANPASNEDRDMLNSAIDPRAETAIAANDQNYIMNEFLPLVNKARDIPTDAVGFIEGMIGGRNQQQALAGLDILRQLKETNPDAYARRVSQDLQDDVEFYTRRKDYYPVDELLREINRARTPQEEAMREQLRNTAVKLVGENKLNPQEVLDALNTSGGAFGFGRTSMTVESLPWTAQTLIPDFQALFVDEYVRYNDVNEAKAAALERIKGTWGMTTANGTPTLMKYPPERMGYEPIGGNFDWIKSSLQEQFTSAQPFGWEYIDQPFQLISTDETFADFSAYQRGQGELPRYAVAVFGPNGWESPPILINFEPGVAAAAEEAKFLEQQASAVDASAAMSEEAADANWAEGNTMLNQVINNGNN